MCPFPSLDRFEKNLSTTYSLTFLANFKEPRKFSAARRHVLVQTPIGQKEIFAYGRIRSGLSGRMSRFPNREDICT